MFILGLWLAITFAVISVLVSIIAAAVNRDELIEEGNESLSFIRLALTGIFGIVFVQTLASLNLSWWVTAGFSFIAMLLLLFGSQLAARVLADKDFSRWLAKGSSRLIRSLDLFFQPLSVAKPEVADEFEQELLDSVDEFGQTIVREVMVPRIDMAVVKSSDNLASALEVFMASGYSRLPVLGRDIDDVVGIIYLKDVTTVFTKNPKALEKATASEFSRKPLFVPDSKPVDDLLREMQVKSTHIAIVVDEYGGVAGLVTMEDLIEEIVGDISDEYDREVTEIQEIGQGQLRVSAKCSLFDLGERLEIELEDEDVDSVGGLLTKLLGRLPLKGDAVEFSGLTFTADRIEGRRKRLISVLVSISNELRDAEAAFGGEPK